MITNRTPATDMEYRGLSTDEKPMHVCNGAVFVEMDTSNVYMFDKENQTWIKMDK